MNSNVKFPTASAIRPVSGLLILTHFPPGSGSGEKKKIPLGRDFFLSRYRYRLLKTFNTINKFGDMIPVVIDFSTN